MHKVALKGDVMLDMRAVTGNAEDGRGFVGLQGRVAVLRRDPDANFDEDRVQFRLTYEGLLLGASRTNTRADHKQELRKVFHKQLRRLWSLTPWLDAEREVPSRAARFARNGYSFVPSSPRICR